MEKFIGYYANKELYDNVAKILINKINKELKKLNKAVMKEMGRTCPLVSENDFVLFR